MFNRQWLGVLLLGAATIAACGGSAELMPSGSSSQGTGGESAGGGGVGGIADGGHVPTGSGQICGMGVPCNDGAKCSWFNYESGFDCFCDPSGHYFCDPAAGGAGAPPFTPCSETTACWQGADSCFLSNGHCSRSCDCEGSCEFACEGAGADPVALSFVCDLSLCEELGFEYAQCTIEDDACSLALDCTATPPSLEETCD